ncbi:Rz1-like lysis system protein LysC [Pseudescherichia vulneris]|uniref:Rz1-like lysis system protein LysC n=1 Tax=Pseudescherichia vulneris TaxID=566 RepID=UPI003C7A07B5
MRMMSALSVLFLLMQIVGCGTTQPAWVPAPPLPASLTAETPQPAIPPGRLRWGQSLDLNLSLLAALGQCNRDKADIRDIEIQRQTSQK